MIQIHNTLSIPLREIQFVYGTSSGPGGQHVNKVATKATLLFSIPCSTALNSTQGDCICKKLSTRINKKGILRVSSSKYRSQRANRDAVIARFAALLFEALKKPKKRKKSFISQSQKQKRLNQKKKRSETKRLREKVQPNKH